MNILFYSNEIVLRIANGNTLNLKGGGIEGDIKNNNPNNICIYTDFF